MIYEADINPLSCSRFLGIFLDSGTSYNYHHECSSIEFFILSSVFPQFCSYPFNFLYVGISVTSFDQEKKTVKYHTTIMQSL